MALWKAEYERRFGRPYKITGRDGKAVKTLLNEPNATAEDLIGVAIDAWKAAKRNPKKFFYCSKLVNIHQLDHQWNELKSEIDKSQSPQDEFMPTQPTAQKKPFTGF